MLTPWALSGFSVSAWCRGAGGEEGGDFYTLAARRPGRIGVVVGDVCGRGAYGAARLSQILPQVRALALSRIAPGRLLSQLNRVVADELPIDCFVTAAAFELDAQAKVLTVANAAHVPAMLRKAGDGSVSLVGHASGVALGMDTHTGYREERYAIDQGDVLVLMTDGVLEALEPDLLSMSTVTRLLGEAACGGREAHRVLLQNLAECSGGRGIDDMTLVTLEVIADSRVEADLCLAQAS